MPYTNVRLIGTQTHGKYCTGWMLSAEDMYEKCPQELKNWGIYVMVSIYQNADGKTPCMPDGLIPDIQIEDDPIQAYQIGDVNEPLLKRKHSVNHVFLSPTSIINFTSKKQSYDDTRRSSRDNELLQRAQSDL